MNFQDLFHMPVDILYAMHDAMKKNRDRYTKASQKASEPAPRRAAIR